MPRAFSLRGIVEGFYGPPWSYGARRDVLSFVAPLGMNAYVYAPKDDPFHRTRWREPYPADEQAALRALAAHCREVGVRFGFAISPGLDITYESEADRAQLDAKLAPLIDAGVDWFVLALDDIPAAPGLAARQAELATWLHGRVGDQLPGAAITVCPTEYVGTRPSPYLGDLAAGSPTRFRSCGPARPCARRASRSPTRPVGLRRSPPTTCCSGTTIRSTTAR